LDAQNVVKGATVSTSHSAALLLFAPGWCAHTSRVSLHWVEKTTKNNNKVINLKQKLINPFAAMVLLKNDQYKCKIFLFSLSHWHVKGFSSKRVALKVDVL